MIKDIAQNLKDILRLPCSIPHLLRSILHLPFEEFSVFGFLVFAVAINLNNEALRDHIGYENRTDDYIHGPTQVNAPEDTDEIATNNVTTDVQSSATDDNAQITRSEDVTLETNREEGPGFESLPHENFAQILGRLQYECVFLLNCVSKKLKSLVVNSQEMVSLREKVKLTALYFFIEDGLWQWAGFDLYLKKWRRMPTLDLNFLPVGCRPDPDLFKEFLVCSSHGLVCINFSKDRTIVFNPMSRKYRELPAMTCPRNLVFMHIVVDPGLKFYLVITGGSAKAGDENLSRVTEVYDSRTGKWKKTGDIPGPAYALNEFQSGVYKAGKVFCVGFVDQVSKGILVYDVEEGAWSTKWTHKFSPRILKSTILQLVELMGEIYLFSEGGNKQFIDRLKWTDGDEITCTVSDIVQKEKFGGRSLEVYPQSICVPFNDDQLCIFDTIDHTGVVHDIRNQHEFPLDALPEQGFKGELGFFSLNTMSFMVEPDFGIQV